MHRSLPATPRDFTVPEVSVIVPARNEEANIRTCLQSLTSQTGVTFEIIVVDDDSSDRTREIAESIPGVQVIRSETPLLGWTGKNNALIAGARKARADWLLFTDADTEHLPGSLKRALDEARIEQADLLSYSPKQMVGTFAERAVMPVIFAQLAAQYPPHKVREQNSGIVAANGQYILVRRKAYDAVGGHAAVASEILEDVALARLFRDAGYHVYFRYGGDAVRTRMYRNWTQLREGWTKNLALLFPNPQRLALQSMSGWLVGWWGFVVALFGAASQQFVWIAFAPLWLWFYWRIRTANFSLANNLVAIAFGPPMFAYLLLRSKRAHENGHVTWKGRAYDVGNGTSGESPAAEPILRTENQKLRTEN